MLFAAGLGSRLKPFTDHAPKALAEVNGKTLLEHNIRYLQRFGIYEVIVNVHHFADMIEDALFEHDNFGSEITISDERAEVLETGGGLKKATHFFDGEADFVVMNVDVLTNLDLEKMITEKIMAIDLIETEKRLHAQFKKELQYFRFAGALTGLIIGSIQVLITLLLN